MDPIQNGFWINILKFKLKLAWLASFCQYKIQEYIIWSKAIQANFNLNKIIVIQQPFYTVIGNVFKACIYRTVELL